MNPPLALSRLECAEAAYKAFVNLIAVTSSLCSNSGSKQSNSFTMCCWGYEDVYLEEAPPKKKEPEPEENKYTYVIMDSDLPKPVPAETPVQAPVSHVFSLPPNANFFSHLTINITLYYCSPTHPTCESLQFCDLCASLLSLALVTMVYYYEYPHDRPPPPPKPKNGWELLAEKQAEAARNVQIAPPKPAPAIQPPAQYAVQPSVQHSIHPAAPPAPQAMTPHGYYYYVIFPKAHSFDPLIANDP